MSDPTAGEAKSAEENGGVNGPFDAPPSFPSPPSPPLPPWVRLVGLGFALVGAILGYLRARHGFQPAALDLRVFALHSSYFETRVLTRIDKNVTGELACLLLLLGLHAQIFSREANEANEATRLAWLRLRALAFSLAANGVVLSVGIGTVFGLGFVALLLANMFFVPAVYLVTFRTLVALANRRARAKRVQDAVSRGASGNELVQ